MENNACMYYTQHHAEINGIKVWHYLIDTPIAQVNIIAHETSHDGDITRKLFDGNYEKAERYYHKICRSLINTNGQPNRTKLTI